VADNWCRLIIDILIDSRDSVEVALSRDGSWQVTQTADPDTSDDDDDDDYALLPASEPAAESGVYFMIVVTALLFQEVSPETCVSSSSNFTTCLSSPCQSLFSYSLCVLYFYGWLVSAPTYLGMYILSISFVADFHVPRAWDVWMLQLVITR